MILLLDNYDSFTYNLVDYFKQLGVSVRVLRNDEPFDVIVAGYYTGVVLSPGPEKPEMAGQLMKITEYFLGKLPMLGICLGHQAIGIQSGVRLIKAEKPMHGKISKIRHSGGVLFHGLPEELEVVRYHSLILEEPPQGFNLLAETKNNEIMAFESQALKAHGLQFHPEAILTEYGLEMLRNWVSFYNIV